MAQNIYRIYCRIEEIITGFGFAAIVALTFMNAVLRVFGRPIIFADDVSLLLFGWVAFLGADVALRYSRLVGMDILVSKFAPKAQKFFQIAVYVIMTTALALFAVKGYELALGNWRRQFNTLPISYGWVSLSLPVCSVLMIFTALIKIVKVVSRFGDDSYNVRKDNPDIVGEEYTGVSDSMETGGMPRKGGEPS
ncbi:MAG: TRAP transporter small permease [Synergistaceae bacterium]|jgi:TRAP-type C4-dicarboxylate transport system permease small subunit|nr:TRAP transporter small permease [Synergistaceae bacterium]